MIRQTLGRILGGRDVKSGALGYEKAKALVRSADPDERRAVALDPDVRPELLYFLARDVSPAVRVAVASNPGTPRQADLLLAVDESPEIRTLIAEKVTGQCHSIPHDDGAQLWQLTVSILEALAKDDLVRVRQLVAETARGLDKIPRAIAFTLAKDRVADVAVPALGYPGGFADEELIEIVRGAHDTRIVGAVAQRPEIGVRVADAVVERGDERSIAILLGNRMAEIAPETLDRVIERAPQMKSWHEPLVRRPDLSDQSVSKLSGFVAQSLVEVLEARPQTGGAPSVGTLLQERIAAGQDSRLETVVPEVVVTAEEATSRARRLHGEQRLTEDVVVDALGTDPDFVVAALALRARLAPPVVQKIFASYSAKGLTALAWKAGFSMRMALQLQARVGRLPPKARLISQSGDWPLTQDELSWQIEFFRSLVPGA